MHKFIEKIKNLSEKPKINNFINKEEIKIFKKLYEELPVEINNVRQQIIKKWSIKFYPDLQKIS